MPIVQPPHAHTITRWSVVDMEGMWVKMFDPPTESPDTPDLLLPTNPVPEVLAAAGFQRAPDIPHNVVIELMHGIRHDTWDLRANGMQFFLFKNPDTNFPDDDDAFPSATIRMPRGIIFHCETDGKGPPPHTIHWHGMEPTPMNDGVGHCSMEIGHYVYQWQPQFIGSYFAHCHRNTVQHFEFGLYFLLLIEPPDAYFATQANQAIPIGHCRDGKRRIAANLTAFPQFPGFNANLTTAPDPWTGNPSLKFATDPHASTVPYDVEALWVMDDRDSAWSDLASNARATYPQHGTRPGFNDNFHNNADTPALATDFFAFNDFNADYWYVTGVPVPTNKGGTAAIPANVVIPASLNSGISGSQVSINAAVGQTILVRCLDAAYNSIEVTFPVDVVIIAWDGRALGVAPFGQNEAYLVPAGTPIKQTTARRFDGLIRPTAPLNSYAVVKFISNRGQVPGYPEEVVCTAHIPINIVDLPYGVTAAAGTHGIITSSGTTRVASGGSLTYSIMPDPGYAVSALVVDGTQLPGATTYTFSNITADHYINAYFTSVSGLAVTASAAANGSISPAGETAVANGGSLTYTITPNAGFIVSALVVDGVEQPAATTYTFTNVTASHYINAYFAAADNVITAAAAANGTISPTGPTGVATGANQTFTITPNAGYAVAALVVDGVEQPAANSYTFTNVTASHYINAYFTASELIITAAAGANGSISPAGETGVSPGGNLTYTITPDSSFEITALVVDGVQLPPATSYTFSNVSGNHFINAYFAAKTTYTITAAAAPNGSISPAGATTVEAASNQTYIITPDPGFTVSALVVDGLLLPGATIYTFTDVLTDHYINAYFQ